MFSSVPLRPPSFPNAVLLGYALTVGAETKLEQSEVPREHNSPWQCVGSLVVRAVVCTGEKNRNPLVFIVVLM